MGSVRFQLFGPVQAWRGDVEIDLGPPRQVALVGLLLAAAGQALSTADIIDALWSTNPVDTALNAVHRSVGLLRRLFDPELPTRATGSLLLSARTGYRLLVDETTSDLVAFRTARSRATTAATAEDSLSAFITALDIAAKPVAFGLDPLLRAHPAFVAIDHECVNVALDAVAAARGTTHPEPARTLITVVRRMVTVHPLNEPLQAGLIDMLATAGQRADAITAYHTIRTQLADELGLDPGPELRAAYARILVPGDATGGELSARIPAPAQLPAGTPYFTGRETELADAIAALASNRAQTVLISAIGGMAGIGKTTLAVHWAHRIAEQYPDGQLYLNLRGFDLAGAVVPTDIAVRNALIALGTRAVDIPDDLDAAAALYRSRLAGTRTLIVLDNARDAEHVRPLLPGATGCRVIITSRNRLAGLIISEGAHPITLGLLSHDESHALLTARLGGGRLASEPDATAAIISSCRGLPLALAIIAARASINPTLSLAAVADELREPADTLTALTGDDSRSNLRTVFSWSYQALPQDAAHLFRHLTAHPGPDISTAAAASISARTVAHTRMLLAELVAANLLTEPVPGRYAFHDLVRAYAAELTAETDSVEERRAALERLLSHYLHTSMAAHTQSSELLWLTIPPALSGVTITGIPDFAAADSWTASERTTLVTFMTQTDSFEFDAYIWQLAWLTEDFLTRHGFLTELRAVLRHALAAAQRLDNKRAQARMYASLGRAGSQHGEGADGEASLHHAIELYRELGDYSRVADNQRELSAHLERRGRYTEALDPLVLALAAYEAADNRYGMAVTFNELGWSHAILGNFNEALAYCERALPLLQEPRWRRARASTLDSLGYIRHHLGQHDEAISNYRQAVAYRRDIKDLRSEAATLDRLGDVYHDANMHNDARTAWGQALAILESIASPDAEAVRAKQAR